MPNRVQTLRSSTPGARPVGRNPGELYVNWPDNQLGVIDAAGNAIDLLAVRNFSTLTTYAVGAYVLQSGVLYRARAAAPAGPFNPVQWDAVLTLAGGAMTGPLILAADPAAALGAATKQYADKMLPLTGGAMTGPLILAADPAAALGAATKQYADKMLPLTGGTMLGELVLAADPVNALDATTKQYADLKAPIASPTFIGTVTAPNVSTGTLAASGLITPSASGIKGAVSGDAPAGSVGEVLVSSFSGGSISAAGVSVNVGSLVLSPGDWDLYAAVSGTAVNGTVTYMQAGLGTATNNYDYGLIIVHSLLNGVMLRAAIPTTRAVLTVTTTLYFNVMGGWNAPATGINAIAQSTWARRAR